MARSGITYKQVEDAITLLIAGGDEPTIEKIRAITGGSPNTVHKHFKVWRSAQPMVERKAPELPADIQTALIKEIERQAASAKAEFDKKLAKFEVDNECLATEGEIVEAKNDALEEQNKSLSDENERFKALASERQAEMEKMEKELNRQRVAAEAARMDLARALNKIEAQDEKMSVLANENSEIKTQLKVSENEKVEAEKQVAVAVAKNEALTSETEKQSNRLETLEQEIKALREKHERERAERERQFQEEKGRIDASYQERIADIKQALVDSEKQKSVLIERLTGISAKESKKD